MQSVRVRSIKKWGDEWVTSSTFMHLERLDAQKLLQEKVDGFISLGDYCDLWEIVRTELLVLHRQLCSILSRWMLHEGARGNELPGYFSPVQLRGSLLAAAYQLSTMSTFASLMGMTIQEEINAWYSEGQWKKGSNASVKKALECVSVKLTVSSSVS